VPVRNFVSSRTRRCPEVENGFRADFDIPPATGRSGVNVLRESNQGGWKLRRLGHIGTPELFLPEET